MFVFSQIKRKKKFFNGLSKNFIHIYDKYKYHNHYIIITLYFNRLKKSVLILVY